MLVLVLEEGYGKADDLEVDPRLSARQLARVAARLKELRGSTISQRELARRTGLSARTIGQIEQGRHEPRLGTLLALRGALGVSSIEELLGPMPSTALESVRELPDPGVSGSEAEYHEID